MSDMERLELFEKLEKAEGRIVALEQQVKYSAPLFNVDVLRRLKLDRSSDKSFLSWSTFYI